MSRGTAILLAALAASLALPLLALGFNLPWWLSALLAGGVFGGLYLFLGAPRGIGPGLSDEAVLEARSDTARGLVTAAAIAVDRLRKAGKSIKDQPMQLAVMRLADIGDRVLDEVREDPNRAMAARRLMTFYLPNAASVAEGWRTLESRALPSPERMTQTRDVMQGLTQAFAKYADDLAEPELQTLDLDLKVLKDALKADVGQTP